MGNASEGFLGILGEFDEESGDHCDHDKRVPDVDQKELRWSSCPDHSTCFIGYNKPQPDDDHETIDFLSVLQGYELKDQCDSDDIDEGIDDPHRHGFYHAFFGVILL